MIDDNVLKIAGRVDHYLRCCTGMTYFIRIVIAIARQANPTYGDSLSPVKRYLEHNEVLFRTHIPIRAALNNKPGKLAESEYVGYHIESEMPTRFSAYQPKTVLQREHMCMCRLKEG